MEVSLKEEITFFEKKKRFRQIIYLKIYVLIDTVIVKLIFS